MAPQYAYRAQKTTGVANGPSWSTIELTTDVAPTRSYAFSPDGELIAFAFTDRVSIYPTSLGEAAEPTVTITQPNVIALSFSPLGTTLFTFERPVKSEGGEVYKNVKAWDKTGQLVGGWYQKTQDDWEPTVSPDEKYLLRPTGTDILVFTPVLAPRPSLRLKLDGPVRGLFISRPTALPETVGVSKPVKPYSEPAVAVWVGEKQGAPASVALHTLSSLVRSAANTQNETLEAGPTETMDMPQTQARKAFYKADKLSVKWNHAGTMALFLTHTDVDNSGKSYYGETNLYLVALDGKFDGLVDLDKEGPIYDFAWSPNSREFSVCYGYMPSRTQIYDHRAKAIHSFGSAHRNFLAYQPQGRLLLSAGFGNLAGGVDVWEISTRKKIAEFTASNSSWCEWSPCGRFILTATLSPRLRVDNGVKIWWCDGKLLHIHPQDDLYQVTFKPQLIEKTESFPSVVPPAPEANPSVASFRKETPSNGDAKPVGAYRPPGARGTVASDAYRRNDDDSAPSSGTSTPMFRGGKPAGRYIPGAPIPGAANPQIGATNGGDDKKKRTRTKNKKKDDGKKDEEKVAPEPEPVADTTAADGGEADAIAKKIRNLTKKLKAIEELKVRLAGGEVLEKTQLQKIETEASVRAEVIALGGSA